tara:strand:- start:230 stop:919 length:690 start_codon:yes stop_codon:yes gene_type:complete
MKYIKNVTYPYKTRFERVEFAVKTLIPYTLNNESILNIGGGGQRHLEQALDKLKISAECTEVDMHGDNDITINLDEKKILPFQNNQFTYCLLNDVLEHLENFHLILNESFRVTKKILVISLPIPSNNFLHIIKNKKYEDPLKNENGFYDKFYGLPHDIPEDRHRWWFTYDDVISFFENFESKNNCEILVFSDLPEVKGWEHKIIKFFLPKRLYRNFFHNAIWLIVKKKE